jgi:hypothetical protein
VSYFLAHTAQDSSRPASRAHSFAGFGPEAHWRARASGNMPRLVRQGLSASRQMSASRCPHAR